MMSCTPRLAILSLLAATALPLSAQFWPSPPEQAAKVVSLTGQVSMLRDSQPWALNVNDVVPTGRVIISGPDGFALLQVADGSTFEVFPNSRVLFRSNPGNWKDLLDVMIGRVKVHIQKLGGQPNPNRITTPTAVISVRGTTFDVVVEDEADVTLVSVDEGSVEVQHALMPRGDPKVLSAGEYLRVYKNVPIAEVRVNKGAIVQQGLRALADAFYTIMLRTTPRLPGGSIPGAPGGGTGGVPTGGIPGDTGSGTPPPPPPPPPPAPPN
jgi:ferric-dicitrate binding protein FerR (iron transport regulator)